MKKPIVFRHGCFSPLKFNSMHWIKSSFAFNCCIYTVFCVSRRCPVLEYYSFKQIYWNRTFGAVLLFKKIRYFKQYVRMFQTLPEAGAIGNVPDTVHDSVFAVERTVLVLVRRGRRLALYVVVALHVAGEQRRSYLGHKTVRQVSIKHFLSRTNDGRSLEPSPCVQLNTLGDIISKARIRSH